MTCSTGGSVGSDALGPALQVVGGGGQRGLEQLALAGEVVVEQRLGDAGLAGDARHRQLLVAVRREELGRARDELLATLVAVQACVCAAADHSRQRNRATLVHDRVRRRQRGRHHGADGRGPGGRIRAGHRRARTARVGRGAHRRHAPRPRRAACRPRRAASTRTGPSCSRARPAVARRWRRRRSARPATGRSRSTAASRSGWPRAARSCPRVDTWRHIDDRWPVERRRRAARRARVATRDPACQRLRALRTVARCLLARRPSDVCDRSRLGAAKFGGDRRSRGNPLSAEAEAFSACRVCIHVGDRTRRTTRWSRPTNPWATL